MSNLEELYTQAQKYADNHKQYEEKLIHIIKQGDNNSDEDLKAKELCFYDLADLYCENNQAQKVLDLIKINEKTLKEMQGAKSAKILKNLTERVGKLKNIVQIQVDLCQYVIDWCKKEERTHLKHKQLIRLSSLYLLQDKFKQAIDIIEDLLLEVRKTDDKHLLVEAQLIESKLHFALENFAKAKASLTSSRACSNQVYCEPALQAELDLQSGIIFAQEKDFKTSYSYFYEAFEALHNLKDHKALDVFKYMILCKVMTKQHDDVNGLIAGKYGTHYAGIEVEAVKEVAKTIKEKSLIQFQGVQEKYKQQLSDQVIEQIVKILYEVLLEENLFKIIEPYSRVQINHIAKTINLTIDQVQKKLSELILDKKIEGTLDQGNGCLILFDDQKCDNLYPYSIDLINQMDQVVEKLFFKSKLIKK